MIREGDVLQVVDDFGPCFKGHVVRANDTHFFVVPESLLDDKEMQRYPLVFSQHTRSSMALTFAVSGVLERSKK